MSRTKRIPPGRAAPDFRRRNNQREPYDRVLIVCEGSTEKYYFEGLISLLGLSSANIRIHPSGNRTDPIQVLSYGLKLAQESHNAGDTYQRLYCVFDLDRPHQDAFSLAANTKLPKTTLHLATSTPCFEIWLRLHFGYTDKSFSAVGNKTACQAVEDDLLSYVPHYSKGNARMFSQFAQKVHAAVANCRKLEANNHQTGSTNPGCSVHELASYLCSLREQPATTS
jgi:RloB-like protein